MGEYTCYIKLLTMGRICGQKGFPEFEIGGLLGEYACYIKLFTMGRICGQQGFPPELEIDGLFGEYIKLEGVYSAVQKDGRYLCSAVCCS